MWSEMEKEGFDVSRSRSRREIRPASLFNNHQDSFVFLDYGMVRVGDYSGIDSVQKWISVRHSFEERKITGTEWT